MTSLEVMICTYGVAGIRRVAAHSHPRVEGVRYLVGWQMPKGEVDAEVPEALLRDDFIILRHASSGLSKNRNYILARATAPLLLVSDDDVDYTTEGLCGIIESFARYPHCDLLTFRYETAHQWKTYPAEPRSIWRGYGGIILIVLRLLSVAKPYRGALLLMNALASTLLSLQEKKMFL